MRKFNIRRATINDIPMLKAFEQGVITAEQAFDPTLKKDAVYYDFNSMLEAPHIEILVAETSSGELIGSGFARIESAPPYLQHDQFAYLAYMYVKPGYRRQGVNKLIIDGLTQWSREHGVREIRLKVYVENHGALEAYKKAGFSEHAVEMRMCIE